MDTLLFGEPLRDWLIGCVVTLAFTTLIQFGSSLGFVKFVGLQSPPIRRAFLTALAGYALCVAALISMLPTEWTLLAPLLSLPATVITYLYWKPRFIRAWYEDPSLIPEGMAIANQDWRVGLYVLLAAVVVAVIKKAPVVFSVQQATGN